MEDLDRLNENNPTLNLKLKPFYGAGQKMSNLKFSIRSTALNKDSRCLQPSKILRYYASIFFRRA